MVLIIGPLLFLLAITLAEEPEASMDTPQIIERWGYPIESYEVTTSDGYILTMHRIPHGKNNQDAKKGPIFIQHGVLGSSADWVLNIEQQNLAFVLSEQGYDVWLGNFRGNKYSGKHTSKNPTFDLTYWDFSMDENGRIDLPAMFDFMLSKTGVQKAPFIGYSMGAAAALILLSTDPKYGEKMMSAHLLAPAAYVTHAKGSIGALIKINIDNGMISSIFGVGPLNVPQLVSRVASGTCSFTCGACQNALFTLMGFDEQQTNCSRMNVYLGHMLAGASVKQLFHFSQNGGSDTFRKYNFGPLVNQQKYSRMDPPPYPLEDITVPIAVYWGENDWLVSPEDAAKTISQIPTVKENYKVPWAQFTHIDFYLAKDAKTLLYDKLCEFLGTVK